MNLLNINPKDIIFALDIGTRSIIGTVGIIKDKKFQVISEKYLEHDERAMVDGQIHDITLVANTVNKVKKELEKDLNLTLEEVAIAAAGRFLRTIEVNAEIDVEEDKEIDKEIIRSLELTAVKKAEEEINKQTQGKLYCVGYSVKNYYLNGYIISNLLSQKGENISADIIVTFLPRSVVDSLYSVMNKVNLTVSTLTLEPIAAMEAAVPKKLRLLNLALVDIGAGTSDIAISSKETISAYGMVPMAGDEVTECIVQNYLVDFNTAEVMKKQCTIQETVKYMDVLGLENEVSSEEIIKTINPVIQKICEEVANRIIELNGGKSPNAVFLVGGGAHTPNLKEYLAEKLNLSPQRVGIKGRDAVIDCTSPDNGLGSIGVTVLGIALVRIRQAGNDFIDVILNNEVVSLFNSHKHTIMDVMIQTGINHKVLIGKNGKNIRFVLNGIKRVAFGSLAESAIIKLNDKVANIDTEIKEGDKIEVVFAKDGKDAVPKLIEYVKKINSISFYLNDIIQNLDPVGIINNKIVEMEEYIKEGDEVEIIFPSTLGEYIKYFNEDNMGYKYYLRDKEIFKDYVIKEGDRIYKEKAEYIGKEEDKTINNEKEEVNIDTSMEDGDNNIIENEINKEDVNQIEVIVNDKPVVLQGKEEYVFVDIFTKVDFDLSVLKGNLVLTLNDKKAGYYDKLKNGDVIKIFWDK
ncbi:cell division protein FtsA [Clostridium sp. ZS2-4]|uniref:cell division protein FtsA n=1 Tax=Clostridium sp. ZS2-4 TaxID=2987703 RepID=UPI00227A3DB8|nr:cell division FtsA domain-containing protein [Clostridium sp. ZS2-4]MCY6355009.1 rod shape-determining protein [Clostridium sp. ZS2-4]